ncbi:UbiA prenyltransferase family, partial [Desarmillaria tabescens]
GRYYFELTRLHKFPLGSIVVFWPCAWAFTVAASTVQLPVVQFIKGIIAFALGSTLLHSAACVLNDICDIDFDRQRTKNRPLVIGKISIFGATILLILLTSASLSLLCFTSLTAAAYGIIGVFPLHALYPLMKRWTWWPQAWLGLAMNWGIWVAWITVYPSAPLKNDLLIFFLGTVCWTIVYDTIYGCQDKIDDAKAGVKSTALLFGTWVRPILICFAGAFVGSLAYFGVCNDQSFVFFVVSCGGAALHFFWQFTTWSPDDPGDCGEKFKANGSLGYIIWAGML